MPLLVVAVQPNTGTLQVQVFDLDATQGSAAVSGGDASNGDGRSNGTTVQALSATNSTQLWECELNNVLASVASCSTSSCNNSSSVSSRHSTTAAHGLGHHSTNNSWLECSSLQHVDRSDHHAVDSNVVERHRSAVICVFERTDVDVQVSNDRHTFLTGNLSQVCVLDRSHGRSGERSYQGQSHCGEFECVHFCVPVKLS